MIDVSSKLTIYEINGEETKGLNLPTITVSSHWNVRDWVVIEVEGKKFTVVANDLKDAVDNATNTGYR